MPVYRRKTAEKYWGLEKPVRRAVSATEQPSSSSRRARWIRATVICRLTVTPFFSRNIRER